MTNPTTPITSQTGGPGLLPNVGQPGQPGAQANPLTHSSWVQSMVEYYASLWSHGQRDNMPVGLNISMLDPNDTGGYANAGTVLALTQFFQNYTPTGQNPNIDSSYIAPGPNDFVEDPVVTAARIANDQWQQNFDRQTQQWGLTFSQQERQQIINAYNSTFQQQLVQYADQIGLYNDQVRAQLDAFNTNAGIYTSNENRRVSSLDQAGNLASTLQQIEDKRTQDAIALQANPNDLVQREYAVRALNAPQGTNVPAYNNTGATALGQVIQELINYKPEAPPLAPPNAQPGQVTPPTAPNQSTFQLPGPLATALQQSQQLPPAQRTPAPTQYTPPTFTPTPGQTAYFNPATGTYGPHPPAGLNNPNPNLNSTLQNPQYTSGGGSQIWNSATQSWMDTNGNPIPSHAMGTLGTAARKFIVGDPQADGKVNPEIVQIKNPGPKTRARITPIKNMGPMAMAAYGYGAYAYGNDNDVDDYPMGRKRKLPRYADGTDSQTLKSYDDSAYQNFPSLAYLQGNLTADQYNALDTRGAGGAFGSYIPGPGSLNYKKYLDVARDPVSLAATASLYSSANRNLASDIARAKARAPFGQAISTSLVKT